MDFLNSNFCVLSESVDIVRNVLEKILALRMTLLIP
jgi:hypothetical protein